MSEIWNFLFDRPILNSLIFLYKILGNNFGLAIITLTLGIRTALIPLILPSLRSARVLRDLQPELDKLKKKYKDKRKLQEEQLKLYREHGVNPAAGCLPYLLQFLILIALYRVFIHFIQTGMVDNTEVKMDFLWLNLAQPDVFIIPVMKNLKLPGLFIISAALAQLFLSKLTMPAVKAAQIKAKETEEKSDDMAAIMQKQMIFVMPLMTILVGMNLPSGLALYWLVTTVFSIFQQYLIKSP